MKTVLMLPATILIGIVFLSLINFIGWLNDSRLPNDSNDNGYVDVCLDDEHDDCDYFSHYLTFPLKGRIQLEGEYHLRFDDYSMPLMLISPENEKSSGKTFTFELSKDKPIHHYVDRYYDGVFNKTTISWDIGNGVLTFLIPKEDGSDFDLSMFIPIKKYGSKYMKKTTSEHGSYVVFQTRDIEEGYIAFTSKSELPNSNLLAEYKTLPKLRVN